MPHGFRVAICPLPEGYYSSLFYRRRFIPPAHQYCFWSRHFWRIGTAAFFDSSSATATASDLLGGVIAYAGGERLVGTMPDLGSLTVTPGISDQNFGPGYISSLSVPAAANLASANLAYGANVFGVVGDNAMVVNTGSGNATAADLRTGKQLSSME